MILKPYKFKPVLKTVIWGGERIKEFKGIDTDLHQVGESWELSGIDGHESVVDGGPDDGLTLTQLIDRHGADLVGERVYRQHVNQFPLLIKLIDAHRDLSVQVHPDDAMAERLHGCSGKTEMWYVIDHEPGAQIMAGFSRPISLAEYEQHISDNSIMDVIAHHESARGKVFFLPARCVHAIGAGNFVAEIQQPCDITYRMYDYNRLGDDGKPRQLHLEQAREALNYSSYENCVKATDARISKDGELVSCSKFVVRRLSVKGDAQLATPSCFVVLMCIEGSVMVVDEQHSEIPLQQGETLLIPACMSQVSLRGNATLLAIHV